MPFFETCIKLAAYLFCIGLALEFAHKAYWRFNTWVLAQEVSTFSRSILSIMIACVPMTATITVTALFITLVDKKSLLTLGLNYTSSSFTYIAYGALIALLCVMFQYIIGLVLGFIQVKRSRISQDCVACMPLFFGGLVDFFSAAVFEEIIFRGYIFYLVMQTWGVPSAILVSSVIFSIAHVIKHPQTPIIFTVNALFFGVLAALSRYYTGALWLPIGLHFGWNVVAGPILGLPYCGRTYDRGVIVSEVSGPEWLTGGLYSLDAGVLGTAALIIAAAGLIAVAPIH